MEPEVRAAIARSFLAELPAATRERLLSGAVLEAVIAGTTTYRAGEEPRMSLVVSGLFRTYVAGPDGRQVTIRYARAGDVLGIVTSLAGPAPLAVALRAHHRAVLALGFAYLAGLGGTLMAGMGNNMLQATTEDAFRGRVMSLWGLLFIGIMPVGQLALGALGSIFGIHAALAFGGIVALGAGVYARRAFRRCASGARHHADISQHRRRRSPSGSRRSDRIPLSLTR